MTFVLLEIFSEKGCKRLHVIHRIILIIIIIIMVIINTLSTNLIHISLCRIFYTHVEQTPIKTSINMHTHTHTHTRTHARTHARTHTNRSEIKCVRHIYAIHIVHCVFISAQACTKSSHIIRADLLYYVSAKFCTLI